MTARSTIWVFVVLIVGCHSESGNVTAPNVVIPEGYPAILKFSQARYDAYVAMWISLTKKYNFDQPPPRPDSVLMVPFDWDGSIDLFPETEDTLTGEEVSQRLHDFVDEWKDLFNLPKEEIDRISWRSEYGAYWFHIYKKSPYENDDSHYIHGGVAIKARATLDGKLTHFDVNSGPAMPIPAVVNYDSSYAKIVLRGKLILDGYSGRDTLILSYQTLTSPVVVPLILIRYDPHTYMGRSAIEYRRAWRFTAGFQYIYVDAITGEDLNYNIPRVYF